ncbi:hypothetical protein [Fodinicola acaciae]|uniref:hypothetical protein n=1 Tax=Fodinicola acaciae TaxID=2681555 RepID=UPI0013D84499|nr:hypothetical protein [Fodinicola acaciae]
MTVATWALGKYVGALPINGVEVSQYLTAIAAQIQALPGGRALTGAIGYASAAGPLAVGTVAASYVGDRYKSGRKAQVEQQKNQAEQQKRAEQRQRGVDVDTDPYEQIHALKTQNAALQNENAGLQAQVSELQQFKAYVEGQFAAINDSLRDAYGAHVATNQRIDNLERQPVPWSRPDDDDPGFGPDGPRPPAAPPPGAGPKPPAPPPAAPSQMLSRETSNQARNLLSRAQQTQQTLGKSKAEPPTPPADRQRGATPYQAPATPSRPRR